MFIPGKCFVPFLEERYEGRAITLVCWMIIATVYVFYWGFWVYSAGSRFIMLCTFDEFWGFVIVCQSMAVGFITKSLDERFLVLVFFLVDS